jgi:Domain of unknown function (DUF4388)
MSFTGDLEHLSIVDVIQLLHATRKSGTLWVQGRKGESQLVFQDGYIVSANHVDNHVRIGNLLVENNVLTEEQLHLALLDQNSAGADRKPLIAMLLEQGQVQQEDAYRCLEWLIELTIVEIIGWRRGTFTLDVDRLSISDEYRYFPEKLNREIFLHTENVLMDALRIYDERVRDGKIMEEELEADEAESAPAAPPKEAPAVISAIDLGLDDMEAVPEKNQQFFQTIEDHTPIPRRSVTPPSNLPPAVQEALLQFVDAYPAVPEQPGVPVSVIFISHDDFLSHCLTVVCKQEGVFVFTTSDPEDIGPIIQQSLARKNLPVLVFDVPNAQSTDFGTDAVIRLRQQKRGQFPHVCMLQMVPPSDVGFSLQALKDGVHSVVPRPTCLAGDESFLNDIRQFLQTFPAYLKSYGADQSTMLITRFRNSTVALRALREPPEIANALLQFTAELFERAITLIVRGPELVAERSIGIKSPREAGISPPLGFKLSLTTPSIFLTVMEKGLLFFGTTDDEKVRVDLFSLIGVPASMTMLLLPLKTNGKVISLVYADFGSREIAAVPVELLEVLAVQAGLVLENAYYRKRLDRPTS